MLVILQRHAEQVERLKVLLLVFGLLSGDEVGLAVALALALLVEALDAEVLILLQRFELQLILLEVSHAVLIEFVQLNRLLLVLCEGDSVVASVTGRLFVVRRLDAAFDLGLVLLLV